MRRDVTGHAKRQAWPAPSLPPLTFGGRSLGMASARLVRSSLRRHTPCHSLGCAVAARRLLPPPPGRERPLFATLHVGRSRKPFRYAPGRAGRCGASGRRRRECCFAGVKDAPSAPRFIVARVGLRSTLAERSSARVRAGCRSGAPCRAGINRALRESVTKTLRPAPTGSAARITSARSAPKISRSMLRCGGSSHRAGAQGPRQQVVMPPACAGVFFKLRLLIPRGR